MTIATFVHRQFDVDIARKVDASRLGWPERGEAGGDDACLGGNRQYVDLRRFSWREAKRVLVLEAELMARIESAAEPADELYVLDEELYDDPDPNIYGLDLGVASVVAALSAARCIPFSSCNGGAYRDGKHQEAYPLVAFFTRAPTLPVIGEAAEQSAIGLHNAAGGAVVAYAASISAMRYFAEVMIQTRAEFDRLRFVTRRAGSARAEPSTQCSLFD